MTSHIITLITNPKHVILNDVIINHIFITLEKKGGRIETLQWLSADEACDIHFEHDDISTLTKNFTLTRYPVDYIFHSASTQQARRKRMLISDMDSTIIQQECIDELADRLGIKERVAKITARAMNNELDFADALRERVSLLKGLDETTLSEVYEHQIHFMPGARELVATMRHHGAHCVLVSGGFTFFTEKIASALGFHEQHANRLAIKDGVLTGHVIEPILDKTSKYESLISISRKHGIPVSDVFALGDGANDIPMLKAAGLGIAYHAHTTVQEHIPTHINHTTLRAALFMQGYSSDDIIAAL